MLADKPKILVVEDNYFMAKTVCDLVRDCGFDVAGAVGRLDAGRRFLSENPIDGAIVDINLNGTPSFAICDELNRRNVPFFFLTAYERSAIPDAFRATRLLTKPVEMKDFRSALTMLAPYQPLEPERRLHDRIARGNRRLEALSPAAWETLKPHLRHVALKRGTKVEEAGAMPEHVYFPTSGLLSVTARAGDRQLEVALIGNEGITGASILLGPQAAANDVTVQLAGEAWQIERARLLDALPTCAELHKPLLNHVSTLMGQISQTALVTGHARIEQRLARWLLMVGERADFDRIEITHANLSRALGVRRAGITVAMHFLESRGAVKSMRKLVRVLNTEELACISDGFYSPLSHP